LFPAKRNKKKENRQKANTGEVEGLRVASAGKKGKKTRDTRGVAKKKWMYCEYTRHERVTDRAKKKKSVSTAALKLQAVLSKLQAVLSKLQRS
jgi:hypothetical protein